MPRKPIEIFSISFLDLISGALGAVILLFIIVPKLDNKTRQELRALNEVNVELTELESILEQAKNSIPKEIYEEIQTQIQSLEDAVSKLNDEVNELQDKLIKANQKIEELETQIQNQQQQIESMNQEIEQLRNQLSQCQANMERIEAEGRFAVITMSWNTAGDDVDLHIIDPSGAEFYYEKPTISGRPGELTRDDVKGPGVEVWQTSSLETGTYQIKANLYKSVSGKYPNIQFWVYYRNGNKSFTKTLYTVKNITQIVNLVVDSEGNVTFN